jgi:purine nucleosidase
MLLVAGGIGGGLLTGPEPLPILLDTDAGDDVDDAYALVLAARWPAVKLEAVSTVFGPTLSRARLARKLLDLCGAQTVPIFPANHAEGHTPQLDWAAAYPFAPPAETAPQALVRLVNERPGELTLVTIGALSNVAQALDLDPHLGRKLKRLVVMGGWVYQGYAAGEQRPEWNIRCDVAAAQRVLACGAPLTMVGLDVTRRVRLQEPWLERLRQAGHPWTQALLELTARWGHGVPVLHDPLALSCVGAQFCRWQDLRLEIDAAGLTKPVPGPPNVSVALEVEAEAFLDWYCATVTRP